MNMKFIMSLQSWKLDISDILFQSILLFDIYFRKNKHDVTSNNLSETNWFSVGFMNEMWIIDNVHFTYMCERQTSEEYFTR